MKCTACGREIAEGAYFCPECGALVSEKQKKSYDLCPHCGCKTEKGAVYCPSCGGEINQRIIREPIKKKSNAPLIAVIAVLGVMTVAAVTASVFVIRGDSINSDTNSVSIVATVTPAAAASATPIPQTQSVNNSGAIATLAPATMPPTVMPTAASAYSGTHRYEVITSHISWEEAAASAQRRGGHLVTIADSGEFGEITRVLSSPQYSNLKNVWIGACAPAGINTPSKASAYWNSSAASWITGEPFTYASWRHGEPSGYDANMGVEERYLQIFRPKADGGVWSYNDASSDLSEYKSDSLGYMVEYE